MNRIHRTGNAPSQRGAPEFSKTTARASILHAGRGRKRDIGNSYSISPAAIGRRADQVGMSREQFIVVHTALGGQLDRSGRLWVVPNKSGVRS